MIAKGIAYTREYFIELLSHQSDEIIDSIIKKIDELEKQLYDILGFVVKWKKEGFVEKMGEVTAVVAKTGESESQIMLIKIYPPT
jgi:hypothetical protein